MNASLKPAVGKPFLLFISGLLWIGVAVLLNSFAIDWLIHYHGSSAWVYPAAGGAAALIIHHFGFLRVVDKNLRRISGMEAKSCAFAFMSWKSYLIVLIMVSMGIILRNSAIPKQCLSILYIGIGFALFLSSIRYFRVLYCNYLKSNGQAPGNH